MADPQSLDLYAYVRNSPMMLTDPLGLDPPPITCPPGYIPVYGFSYDNEPKPYSEGIVGCAPYPGGRDTYYGGSAIGPGTPPGGGAGPGGTGGNTAGAPQLQGPGQPQKKPCTPTPGAEQFLTGLTYVTHVVEAPLVPVAVLGGFGLGIAENLGVAALGCAGTSGILCAVSVPVGVAGAVALGYGAYKYSSSLPAYYRNWWHEASQPPSSSGACGQGGG